MARERDRQREQLWRGRLREQARSGLSIREFCDSRGLLESSFYFWRRELRARDAEQDQGNALPADAVTASLPLFAAVTVSAVEAPNSDLELVLTSGLRVRVPSGFDPQTLRELLGVLEPPAC